MLAVIVTAVIMATPGYTDQDVILKTNYGYSIETLRPKVFFTTDQARIVLHLRVPISGLETLHLSRSLKKKMLRETHVLDLTAHVLYSIG